MILLLPLGEGAREALMLPFSLQEKVPAKP